MVISLGCQFTDKSIHHKHDKFTIKSKREVTNYNIISLKSATILLTSLSTGLGEFNTRVGVDPLIPLYILITQLYIYTKSHIYISSILFSNTWLQMGYGIKICQSLKFHVGVTIWRNSDYYKTHI